MVDGDQIPSHYPEIDEVSQYAWTGENTDERTRGNLIPFVNHNVSSENQYPPKPQTMDLMTSPEDSLGDLQFHAIVPRVAASLLPGNKSQSAQNIIIGSSLENSEDDSDNNDDLTDADSDYMNLQTEIARFEISVRNFRAEQANDNSDETTQSINGRNQDHRRRGRANRGRGVGRGPRKAAEPTGDIKIRLSKASQAFIEEKYEEAKNLVSEVIRLNAETHEAWILLASIFKEMGDIGRTMSALMYAAHLRPKDVESWLNCARFALEESGDQRGKYLVSAKMCFASAIRANPKHDFEGRCGKAAVLREMGNTAQAISEYKRLLKARPHDTTILRLIAEVYIDQDDAEAAKELYRESIGFYRGVNDAARQRFGWSDINIYVELYGYLGQYLEAVRELRSLSRWLLGRQHETYWDLIKDDREWDAGNVRRAQIPEFHGHNDDTDLYGQGLPLELRVKLGLYRLRLGHEEESLSHLRWLDPSDLSEDGNVHDYSDLFREVADSLLDAGLYHEALSFYTALRSLQDVEPSIYIQMGKCYMSNNLNNEAEECFHQAIQLDEDNIEARVQLARLYETLDEQEQAFVYISEILNIRRSKNPNHRSITQSGEPLIASGTGATFLPTTTSSKSYYKPRRLIDPEERERQDNLRAAHLKEQYAVMRAEQNEMRLGNQESTRTWMGAAYDLIEDFRGFKKFYPWDKYVHFLGYSRAASLHNQTGATPLDVDIAAMASRLSDRLGAELDGNVNVTVDIPENYRGISFSSWLDIFLEYALCLVKFGRHRESYEICEAAKDAVVFYHSREDMFLIHVCWCTCAVLANDEETCVAVCRYFMKEYQFTTDSYRMFAALTRLCQSPISWYSSGPTQKYVLRQIKAMDYSLVDERSRERFFSEKGSYSAQDETGRLIINNDMDLPLLMLYGHILYSGTSYSYALNYFFRAYALDPNNHMINLSIGLGYIHYGLKRQSDNRQFHIMQGLTFIFQYYDSRRISSNIEERQEAHYNVARAYHMLGLTHLSLPYYSKVLQEVTDRQNMGREDLVYDAVYNLQSLYAMTGNLTMAKSLTANWLVI